MSFPPNLPQEVQAKIKSLSACQQRIATLDSQLKKAQFEYDELQDELLKYRLVVAKGETTSEPDAAKLARFNIGISNLPNEMLLYIFEYFISINHRRIRTLLIVCKHWHRIIMQSAKLWARIQLSPMSFANFEGSKPSSVCYIEACLQRSQSLLLDIALNYDDFQSCDGYIREQVYYIVRNIADETQTSQILDWTSCLDCEFPSMQYDVYSEFLLQEIDALVGPDGKHMERWQKLDLCLPSWRGYLCALDFWAKFVGRTPRLQSANFSQLEPLMEYISMDDEAEERFGLAFPELSSLRSLTLDDDTAHHLLGCLSLSSSHLRHLDILYSRNLNVFNTLSQFSLLRKLSLKTYAKKDTVGWDVGSKNRPYVTRLPNLEELTLWGDPHILKDVDFEFPQLKGLWLHSTSALYLHPSISPAHIHWSVLDPMEDYWAPENITSALVMLLTTYGYTEVVTVQEFTREFIPLALINLKQSSSLPASLKTITVELAHGQKESIDVS